MNLSAPAVGRTQSEAETEAALRVVAMMIARAEPCDAVLRAVAAQAARRFGPATADVIRYERDGRTTLVADSTHGPLAAGWGSRLPAGLATSVLRTERFVSASVGSRFTAASPVHVGNVLWGLVAVGSGHALPTDTERRLAELAELVATAVANEQRKAELTASRARLVAASDEARRRIERDLHDGAQQFLITLELRLRSLAERPALLPGIRAEIEDIAAELSDGLDDLRELSRGIHPEILSKGGLRLALRALARRSTVPVVMDLRIHSRLPEPVEVGAYYVVSEVLANAMKHGRASTVEVEAETSDGALHVRVRDDGVGGADLARGSGLVGLRDRTEALGGSFAVDSPRGEGTTVFCRLPIATMSA
ncbi:histidine kinase [Pseudonocardia adelaidensis]|uniref:histidine kinase n=2 Tax=Pseudonocardia adelaidensis TaxID=648754 RepID=A0ABP9NPW7_9PSEU